MERLAWRSRGGRAELSKPRKPRFRLRSGSGYMSTAMGTAGVGMGAGLTGGSEAQTSTWRRRRDRSVVVVAGGEFLGAANGIQDRAN